MSKTIKLAIDNGAIIESSDGLYSVPSDIPLPLRLERFRVTKKGDIGLDPKYEKLDNEQIENSLVEERNREALGYAKEAILKSIWTLLSEKKLIAQKTLRGKTEMKDDDFLALLEADRIRKTNALDELEVFALQAIVSGGTQKELRASIIEKAAEWEQSMFILEDKIEGVRQKLEKEVKDALTDNDLTKIRNKIKLLNNLHITASVADIATVLS
jgi:hypothetical protein